MNFKEAERAGLARVRIEPEEADYFQVFGEEDDDEYRAEIVRAVAIMGLWRYCAEVRRDGRWVQVDSCGMVFGADDREMLDTMQGACLDALDVVWQEEADRILERRNTYATGP